MPVTTAATETAIELKGAVSTGSGGFLLDAVATFLLRGLHFR